MSTIRYTLRENKLLDEPNMYRGQVLPNGVADYDEVIQMMVQPGSTITIADAKAVLEDFFIAVERLLLNGKNVHTPLMNFRSVMKGVFVGEDDRYDPNRHSIRILLQPGSRLSQITEQMQLVWDEKYNILPKPMTFYDVLTDSSNDLVTPGGLAGLKGRRLLFDEDDLAQGLFFVGEDGSQTRVEIIGRHFQTDMMFLVPAELTPGQYRLKVQAQFGQELRRGDLKQILTVTS